MIPLPREGSSYHRKDGSTSNRRGVLYVPGSTPDTGNGLPALDRNPYNGYGYVKPYYWLDEFIPYYVETMGVDPPDRTNIPGKRRTRSKGSSKERCLIFCWHVNQRAFLLRKNTYWNERCWFLDPDFQLIQMMFCFQQDKKASTKAPEWDEYLLRFKAFLLSSKMSHKKKFRFFFFRCLNAKGVFQGKALRGGCILVDEYDHCFSTSLKNVQNWDRWNLNPGPKNQWFLNILQAFSNGLIYIYFYIFLGFASQ